MTNQIKILIVDDDPDFIQFATAAFKTKLYEVNVADSKRQGLERVKEETPSLIVLGTLAPRGDAFELHRELKENPQYRAIPMIVVDASPEDQARKGWRRDEGLMLDAEDYVARPVEVSVLVDRVEKLLGRRYHEPLRSV